jgi:hypothetical protein
VEVFFLAFFTVLATLSATFFSRAAALALIVALEGLAFLMAGA